MFNRSLVRLAMLACAGLLVVMTISNSEPSRAAEAPAANPLLEKWVGPYGGVPPFDKVKITDFKPALEAAMAENLAEIDKIASQEAPPTFENTIVALERSGDTLNRVQTIFGVWSSNMSSPEFEPIDAEMSPKIAGHFDKITQNDALFKRIEAVYNSPEKSKLTKEQQRLVWVYYNNYVHAGAKLDATRKKRLSEINQQLAALYTKFSQNLLGDEGELYVLIDKESDLAGLPQSLKDAAAQAAKAKGKQGWMIRNTRSSIDPFLTYADNRELREKAWRLFVNRGDNGDARDNNSTITQILQLRAERAKLFDLPTHAHWKLQPQMAKNPENAMKLMEGVWPAAVARVHEEVTDMQALAEKETSRIKIEPWDYRYYMEKVRKAKYDLDDNAIKPYLQFDKMREAMFWVAGELFDFNFTPVTGLPVFNPDVTVYEVKNRKSGKHVGLWYFDPYARDGKRSGAWMNAYRGQYRFKGEVTTIVSNNANFVKGKAGEPLLISWDDAVTMFHEFGHALHGLSSNVTYPTLTGTNVATDYVEFPSQLLEHWLSTPEVLNKFAVHYQTGKPIPQALVDKIKKAATFNEGFGTTEYLSSALVDMKLHLAGDQKIDPDKFETETLASLGMPSELVMRHRLPQFGHLFQSDDYSAGYYSYLWSDVLTADAFEAFTEGKGPYDKAVAQRLVKYVFSVGNTIDPAEGYRMFRGRDPKVEALMRKRGFPVAK
ncbi:MAG TPA: M3 family metallopeptidase [Pyrinomonadaceae bacterium]|nr:M3 family metallopeptidase [Pyrinomonadaceae bacterium]